MRAALYGASQALSKSYLGISGRRRRLSPSNICMQCEEDMSWGIAIL